MDIDTEQQASCKYVQSALPLVQKPQEQTLQTAI